MYRYTWTACVSFRGKEEEAVTHYFTKFNYDSKRTSSTSHPEGIKSNRLGMSLSSENVNDKIVMF